MALFMVKTWMGNKATPIYGAEWAGTSDPSWVRTDAAVGFSDPNPYYSGMSGSPSSPFDNIMPWAGMRRVTDANAGELVEIPKFYYKWTRDGVKMKLQISMEQFSGSYVSPAHMDRGDGVGERDYVYVGRYHCASDYKSKTGVIPKTSITRPTARTGIHNLGSNIWQNDFALFWTIRMLYLVEYAHWNCQTKIGWGCGNGSSAENMGASDNMPYHTGTMQSSRTTRGVGCQYRYIEGLWDNVYDWIDGIRLNARAYYSIVNPSDFSDSTGGSQIGNVYNSDGYITAWTNPTSEKYAILPSNTNSSLDGTTYICDYLNFYSVSTGTLFGGAPYHSNSTVNGLFYFNCSSNSYSTGGIGTRLMVLPPSRLSA